MIKLFRGTRSVIAKKIIFNRKNVFTKEINLLMGFMTQKAFIKFMGVDHFLRQ